MPVREWVSITDPADDHRRYTFDVSYLLSNYTCIYGQGCKGIREDGEDHVVGCCEHGAYLDSEEELTQLTQWFARLTPDTMQFHHEAVTEGYVEEDDEGEHLTARHEGACIFLNREGFPTGPGCALHQESLRRGERPMDGKPTVCWQLPLHRTIEEEVANDGGELEIHTITAYERGKWGEGGADFGWWCTESPEAFVGKQPVYHSMEGELREMVGDDVYDELAEFLDSRRRQRNTVSFLPLVD